MKAVIYARLSREDEEKIDGNRDSRSIENQVKILTDFAKKNNFEVVDVYIDDGYSGGNQDRPDFQRMIQDAKAKEDEQALLTKSKYKPIGIAITPGGKYIGDIYEIKTY